MEEMRTRFGVGFIGSSGVAWHYCEHLHLCIETAERCRDKDIVEDPPILS